MQDTIPPRHQVESDDSDEDVYPVLSVKRPVPKSVPEVVVHWNGAQAKRQPLLVALDQAGRQWMRGITLDDSEIKGEVVVGDIKVILMFFLSLIYTYQSLDKDCINFYANLCGSGYPYPRCTVTNIYNARCGYDYHFCHATNQVGDPSIFVYSIHLALFECRDN